MWRNHKAMVMSGLLRNLWAVPASACNLISPDTRRRTREVLRMTTDTNCLQLHQRLSQGRSERLLLNSWSSEIMRSD